MRKLKEHIKNGSYAPVYLLHGEERHLIESYLEKMVAGILASVDASMNYDVFSDPKTGADEIANAIDTLPFFADRRLVVLNRLGLASPGGKEKAEKVVEALAAKPEETYVILVEEKADKRTKLYKHVEKQGHVALFEPLSESATIKYIANTLGRSGKRIDAAAAKHLIDYAGTDLSILNSELEKLAAYVGEEQAVRREDIEAVCTRSIESRIFDLIDCMGAGRRPRALQLYHDLLLSKEAPLRILYMLSRQFRTTYKAKLYQSHGMPEASMAAKLKVHPFAAKKSMQQARSFTLKQLEKALGDCLETEYAIKQGLADPEMAIEGLVIRYSG